jgi:hypothetical protein
MANSIHVQISPYDVIEVQVSCQHALLAAQRAREHISHRIDDDAAAGDHDVIRVALRRVLDGVVGWVVFLLRKLARREHEAAALERDVPHRRLPGLPRIYGRRTVDLRSLGIVERAD